MGELQLLPTEQQRVEDRRADLVAKITKKTHEFILHVEIQNDNDPKMDLRMPRYYTDIALAYPDIPIHQYLIYIGKDRLRMAACRKDDGLDYSYTIIDMHDVDYRILLNQDTPDAVVLAILGDFKQHSPRKAVRKIVKKLQALLKNSPQRFHKYFGILERLSENRNLENYIDEIKEMITEIDIKKLPSFKWGEENERAKLVRQLLKTQLPEMVATLLDIPLDEIMEIKAEMDNQAKK